MMFNFSEIENKTLKFWKRQKILERILKKRKKERTFVFYQGPPYLNGVPHMGHFFTSVIKDVILRFKTMQGFNVTRKAGWDTHGLPTENEVEKRLGLETKKDIEKLGLKKFIKECQKSIFRYKKIFEKAFERFGFWLDYEKAYITLTPSYIESLWFILKKIWEKGLLTKNFRVSPYCPRCQTVLSSHEVAQEYRTVKDSSIYVKLKILNPNFENTSLLIWTTTPWTLPGNVAVAVNPEFVYVKLKTENEFLILAKERIEVLGLKGETEKEFKGKELVGLKYQPPFDFYQPDYEKVRIWEVLSADFVTLEEGTGLVHIAPAFGEEDMELIKIENLKSKKENKKEFPILLNVDEEGKFKMEVKKWARMFIKDADRSIIEDLKSRNLLFREELYEHEYPFCWRCKTPLFYYAKQSWFIKVSAIKEKLIRNNQKIKWIPDYLKEGRFGEWLKEIKDWALSRERYWGVPLPIWQCKSCGHYEVIGSLEDLKKQKFSKNRYLILRHGESEMNVRKIIISSLPEKISCPLTENGKKQVQSVAKTLKKEKIDLIISSDLQRTRQTAEIVGEKLGIKPLFSKKLREIKAGEFEGKSLEEYQSFWKEYREKFKKRPRGGENYQDVKIRVYNFLKELEKKYNGKTILLVSHQRPLMMLEGALEGFSIEEFEKYIEPKKIKNAQLKEIEFKMLPYNEKGEIDFHRPWVDEIYFFCPKCQGKMERVSEVIDCWFDSGAMPFAQNHWPFEEKIKNKKSKILPPKLFPADFIAEGIDQTRGWFYTLLAVSTLLGFGFPYKNVISLGHVLDEKGEKMSKSKGNVVDPFYIIQKYGTDTTRWYFFTINQPYDSKLFTEKDVLESFKKFILTLWHCYSFFETYVSEKEKINLRVPPKTPLDRWIVSRLNSLIIEVSKNLENYNLVSSARLIENFVINDLSLWYIRRSRRRFQKPENKKDFKEAVSVLGSVLLLLNKILAPFIPFLSEYFYQKIKKLNYRTSESVHLESWPTVDKKMVDKKLEEKMEKIRKITSMALAERAKAKIKIRQPLKELKIPYFELKKEKDLLELIKEEVNVKEISFGKNFELNTQITPELKEEGIIREFIRQIQDARKKIGLKPQNKVGVFYSAPEYIATILGSHEKTVKKEGRIENLIKTEKIPKNLDFQTEIDFEGKKMVFGIKRIK